MKQFCTLLLLFVATLVNAQNLNIIPQPVSVKQTKGDFKLSKKTVIAVTDEEDKKRLFF